tara:strand:+ start:88 stop:1266 length:1179 start_codon:yes stop_codon:yes gene_type:complete
MKIKYKLLILLIIVIIYFLVHFLEDNGFFRLSKTKIPTNLKENIKLFFPKKIQDERNLWRSRVYRTVDILNKANFSFKINSNEKLKEFRKLIIEDYILEKEQIKFSQLQIIEEIPDYKKIKSYLYDTNIFKVSYYNMNHYGIHHRSKNNCDNYKLIIYANGHSNSAYEHNDFLELKENALNNCYDLLVLGMTGLGFNKIYESSFPGQQLDFDKSSHEVFKTYFDPKFPKKKPLSLMLSGNYHLIKKFIKKNKNYEKIFMVGASGGGWYATFLSSIITEINSSFSIAGTAPLIFYSNSLKNDGDWEQHNASIFNTIDYVDLYLLSTLDKNFDNSRKHFQIYNNEDPCCFTLSISSKLKKIFDTLNVPNFNIVIWNNNKHSLLVKELMKLLRES